MERRFFWITITFVTLVLTWHKDNLLKPSEPATCHVLQTHLAKHYTFDYRVLTGGFEYSPSHPIDQLDLNLLEELSPYDFYKTDLFADPLFPIPMVQAVFAVNREEHGDIRVLFPTDITEPSMGFLDGLEGTYVPHELAKADLAMQIAILFQQVTDGGQLIHKSSTPSLIELELLKDGAFWKSIRVHFQGNLLTRIELANI